MKRACITMIILTALVSFGCKGSEPIFPMNLSMGQPRVVNCSPSSLATSIDPNTAITIVFDKKMEMVQTNNAFSLTSSSGAISGIFSWDLTRHVLTFQPSTALLDAVQYTITITSGAEDENGNDLAAQFVSVFYVNNDLTPPRVATFTPANNSLGVAPNATIAITFSKAIHLDTLHSGVTISPSVQWHFTPDATGTVIAYRPTYNLTVGTTYTISIAGSVTDIRGNALENPLSFTFTVGNDFTRPTVASVVSNDATGTPMVWDENATPNHGIEKNESIAITFSEPIAVATLNQAIAISPACAYYLTTEAGNTRAVIHFTEPMGSATNYTLQITSTLTDTSNNALDRTHAYHFITDGIHSDVPVITSVSDPGNGVWPANMIITLNYAVVPPNPSYSDVITMNFNRPINPTSFKLSATYEMGPSGSPDITDQTWDGTFQVFSFRLRNVSSGAKYRITVRGGSSGTADQWGNPMKEDYVRIVGF